MKALLSTQVGGPETLVMEECPGRRPKAGRVVVSVKACGVNYPDVLIIEDKYQFKPPRPFAPGGEDLRRGQGGRRGRHPPEGRRPGAGQHRLRRHGRGDGRWSAARLVHDPRRHAIR